MFISNIKNYFNNKEYSINIYKNNLYINNYKKIRHIAEQLLIIEFDEFILSIKGENFSVNQMIDNEILFNGNITTMELKNN